MVRYDHHQGINVPAHLLHDADEFVDRCRKLADIDGEHFHALGKGFVAFRQSVRRSSVLIVAPHDEGNPGGWPGFSYF